MRFIPQRLPQTQNRAIYDTCFIQLFLFIDNRRKIKSRKTRFVGRPPLSRLRRRFGPLRGTQRRCAALRAAPQGRYAPHALRAQPFLEHEKKAGGGGNSVNPAKRVLRGRSVFSDGRRRCCRRMRTPLLKVNLMYFEAASGAPL